MAETGKNDHMLFAFWVISKKKHLKWKCRHFKEKSGTSSIVFFKSNKLSHIYIWKTVKMTNLAVLVWTLLNSHSLGRFRNRSWFVDDPPCFQLTEVSLNIAWGGGQDGWYNNKCVVTMERKNCRVINWERYGIITGGNRERTMKNGILLGTPGGLTCMDVMS